MPRDMYRPACTEGHVLRDMYRPALRAQTVKPEIFHKRDFGSRCVAVVTAAPVKSGPASTGSSTLGDREKVGVGVCSAGH